MADRTLKVACFFLMIITTTNRCHQAAEASSYYDSLEYDSEESQEYEHHHRNHRTYPQPITRIEDETPAQVTSKPVVNNARRRDVTDKNAQVNDRTLQVARMSERSIPFNTGVQKVQDQERKRLESRVNEPINRTENGSYKIVNHPNLGVTLRRGQAEDRGSASDSFVFPDTRMGPTKKYIPDVPEECKNLGICENVPNYPEEFVKQLVSKLGDQKQFRLDEMDVPEIAQRIGPPEELELCNFTEKIIIPQAAPDRDGKWYYIINTRDTPLQGILVEICRQNKAPCSNVVFYAGYEAYCKQKYALRYMSSLDENGEIVQRSFRMPSCCSCVVKPRD